ncbi:MAG: putative cysteine peptidase [Deltaproteobacteria bacterium]|nr:putative cysteine peptidase [Deltaproteobacteria bacterium]
MRKKRGIVAIYAIVVIAVCILFSMGATGASASPRELEEIRSAIKAKGAKWHADETSVSKLSMKERKMRLGNKDDVDLAALVGDTSVAAPLATVEAAPSNLDWRNTNGTIYVSAIKNQGSCGSCWAFAVTAALESQIMIGTNGTQLDLAEQILVSCGGGGTCSGGSPSSASTYIRDKGLPLESCFMYTATNNSCSNACAEWQTGIAPVYKVKGWHSATASAYPQRVQDLKNALYAYGPVLATFYVYNDFFSYRSGVYSYTTGAYAGAHAVLIVGYDDIQQAFIVKNSWGTGWGESGYFLVAYSEVGGTSSFAYSAIAYDGYGDNPTPPPPNPPACTYALSNTGKTFKATGGNGNFSISCPSGCAWTASSSATWVTIKSGTSGNGSGQVTYTVGANTGSARTATINVQGTNYNQTYTVTQQAQRARK